MSMHAPEGTHVVPFPHKEDPKKHHYKWCEYYDAKLDFCKKYFEPCHKVAFCKYYKEKQGVKKSEKPVEEKKPLEALPFESVKLIKRSEISISPSFRNSKPNETKIEKLIAFYKAFGQFDKPVVVEVRNGKYSLTDGYFRYKAAEKMGLLEIPAEMGAKEEIKLRDEMCTVGALLLDNKYHDVCEVKEVNLRKIRVVSDSGHSKWFDSIICIKKNRFRIM